MTNNANKIDIYVGSRVKARRQLLGVSQEKLGVALGVTFQQVQKYEKGANRISASRLQQIGAVLGVPASYFFDGLQERPIASVGFADAPQTSYRHNSASTDEGIYLIRAFTRISDPAIRRRIVDLVETIAGSSNDNEIQ